jgi:hypothetical protein
MDIKHVLSLNPLRPTYAGRPDPSSDPDRLGWVDFEGGLVEIGHKGDGFGFDNELPRHEPSATSSPPTERISWPPWPTRCRPVRPSCSGSIW